MARGVSVCQIVILLSCAIYGHSGFPENSVAFGRCPTFPVFKSFNQSQFQGVWVVSERFYGAKFGFCERLNFTATSDTTMIIDGQQRFRSRTSLKHSGRSTTPNKDIPGVMNWHWNYVTPFTDHVTVIDTDYDNYAVIVMCNDFGLLHKNYAIRLIKDKPYGSSIINYIKRSTKVLTPILQIPYFHNDRKYNQCNEEDLPKQGSYYPKQSITETTYNLDGIVKHVSDLFNLIKNEFNF